jgi:hypothetical protein
MNNCRGDVWADRSIENVPAQYGSTIVASIQPFG